MRRIDAQVESFESGLHQAVLPAFCWLRGLIRQAAEVAASQHQPSVEVVALHTAVCFGDHTVADRLAQLATQVDGPRASAAHATTRAHQHARACEGRSR